MRKNSRPYTDEDVEKDLSSTDKENITSEDVENAHAAGVGSLGRSEENLINPANEDTKDSKEEKY